MDGLILAGTAVTLLGVAGLLGCIRAIAQARRAGLGEADLRARLQRIVAWNLGALFLSVVGLMFVVIGILVD